MKERALDYGLGNPKRKVCLFAAVYIVAVLFRFFLARLTCPYPSVLIDEMLYCNIARSIAGGNGILFMGQPANYSFILFPLILSPVYLLFQDGADFYMLIQLWNSALMSLSIFPLFMFAKAVTNDAKKAFNVMLITLLLPDYLLGGMAMGEGIIYPMFFLLMYYAYRYATEKRLLYALGIGLLGGLMFSAKPGQIIPAAVILVVSLVFSIKEKQKKNTLTALMGMFCMIVVCAALYALVVFGFNHRVSFFSMYDAQIQSQYGLQLVAFLKGAFLSPYYLLLSCCGICCLFPLVFFKRFHDWRKRLLLMTFIALLVTMIGTAWIVNRVEYTNPSIHTRYFAMYIPILLIYCLAPIQETQPLSARKRAPKIKIPAVVIAVCSYVIFCSVVFGYRSGIDQESTRVFNLTASVLRDSFLPATADWLGSGLVILGALLTLWLFKTATIERLRACCVVFLIGILSLNNIAAYQGMYGNVYKGLLDETAIIRHDVDGNEYLYVYGTNNECYNASLDVNSKSDTCMVYVNDLFNNMVASDGVYTPFMPAVQKGVTPDRLTPDTRLVVIDRIAYSQMKLAEDVEILTPDEHDMYAVMLPADGRWLDSMMGGVIGNVLPKDTACVIAIYDEQLLDASLKLSFDMELPTASAINVILGTTVYSLDLPAGRDTYNLDVGKQMKVIRIIVKDCDATIYGYDLTSE